MPCRGGGELGGLGEVRENISLYPSLSPTIANGAFLDLHQLFEWVQVQGEKQGPAHGEGAAPSTIHSTVHTGGKPSCV